MMNKINILLPDLVVTLIGDKSCYQLQEIAYVMK